MLSLVGAILGHPGKGRRGFLLAVAGVVLGALAFGVPGNWYRIAKRVPMIHDITTDTENPPIFVSVLGLRKDAPNSAIYGGPEIAAQQHAAYPDIRPLVSDIPPEQTYERARFVARQMCWKIVDENQAEGRIEATATTRWFGFKDDVVIRIAPATSNGSRVDIRSVSRLGRSDLSPTWISRYGRREPRIPSRFIPGQPVVRLAWRHHTVWRPPIRTDPL